MNCALSYLTGVCALILTVSKGEKIDPVFSPVLSIPFQIYYRRENKRRDRVYGPVDPDAKIDTSKLADEVRVVPHITILDFISLLLISDTGIQVPSVVIMMMLACRLCISMINVAELTSLSLKCVDALFLDKSTAPV